MRIVPYLCIGEHLNKDTDFYKATKKRHELSRQGNPPCELHVHFWRRQHLQQHHVAATCNGTIGFKPCIPLRVNIMALPCPHGGQFALARTDIVSPDPCSGVDHVAPSSLHDRSYEPHLSFISDGGNHPDQQRYPKWHHTAQAGGM